MPLATNPAGTAKRNEDGIAVNVGSDTLLTKQL